MPASRLCLADLQHPWQPPKVVGFDPDDDVGSDIVLRRNVLEADESGWCRKTIGFRRCRRRSRGGNVGLGGGDHAHGNGT